MKKISMLGAVLALSGICLAGAPFKIVSYNVRHCAGIDNVRSEKATAKVIVNEKARFVGLQEMDEKTNRVGGTDQPKELGRLTGMHSTFAKAIPLPGGAYGNAMLSREAPLSVKRIPLPGVEPRVLLLAEFKDCFFATMHLDLRQKTQLESIPIVREAVKQAAVSKPVFICGDWNAKPGSPTLKQLEEFVKVISTQKTFTFHGMSKNPIEISHHGCVIDYIAVDTAHAASVKVLDSKVTEDRHTSDHAPISVTLQLQ